MLLLRNDNRNSTAFMWLYTWIACITTDPLPLCSEQSVGALHALHRRKSCCWLPVLIHAADTECWLAKAWQKWFVNCSLNNTTAYNDTNIGKLGDCRCSSFLWLYYSMELLILTMSLKCLQGNQYLSRVWCKI